MRERLTTRNFLLALLLIAAIAGSVARNAEAQAKPKRTIAQPVAEPATKFSSPIANNFSPTQAATGSTVTITFNGANFVARALSLTFEPSEGISVSRLTVVSPLEITAQLNISPTAQTGERQVNLVDADRNLRIATAFTVTEPKSQPTNCATGLTPAGNCGVIPALRSFTPLQGTQGTSVLLTLNGANLAAPSTLQFPPSSGLTVTSTRVLSPTQIQAQVVIAPNASLGARSVSIITEKQTRLTASNTFTVVSPAVQTKPMQILQVVPNQITAGSDNVDLTLIGTNFVPGTQVVFTIGAGVPAAVFANGPARYVDSTEMHVSVNALSSALPGGRDITLQPPGTSTSLIQMQMRERQTTGGATGQPGGTLAVVGKGMLNVVAAPQTGPPTQLKLVPVTVQKFVQGTIVLDAPLGPSNQSDGDFTYTAPPVLNDESVFKWHEQNPGLADYYELRIYGRDGRTRILTQKITGVHELALGAPNGFITIVPTYYRPDINFLKQALAPHLTLPGFVNADTGLPADQLSGLLQQGDLEWEIAGFHTYNTNGVSNQAQPINGKTSVNTQSHVQLTSGQTQSSSSTVDLQVEISDRWPLKAPAAPTGLACSGGTTSGNLNVQNFSRTNNDPNDYMGDLFGLGGTIDLSRSPYHLDFTFQTYVPAGSTCGSKCVVKDIAAVDFSNVYVDWGDGNVESLAAPPATANSNSWDQSLPLALPTNNTTPMHHSYQTMGTFYIRVFQLSNDDLQKVNVNTVTATVDGANTPYLQAAMLTKMSSNGSIAKGNLTLTGVQSNMHELLSGGNSGNTAASQAASDAYMLYCKQVNITPIEDLVADGPLHLISISDPDFGSYNVLQAKQAPVLMNGGDRFQMDAQHAQSQQTAPIKEEPGARFNGPNQPVGPAAAVCSTCDNGMDATTTIKYYGRGPALVTWLVDGVPSQQNVNLGPSPKRMNLTRQGYTATFSNGNLLIMPTPEPPIIDGYSRPIYSPTLNLQPLGNHSVFVEADVLPQPTMPSLTIPVNRALGSLVPSSFNVDSSGSSTTKSTGPNLSEAQTLLKTLSTPAGSNLPPLKIGILSSSNKPVGGLNAVQYVNGALTQTIAQLTNPQPDSHVASNTKIYDVIASDPKQPCTFLFPVQSGGAFVISGLQNHVTQQNGIYNGRGNLIVYMANASSQGYDQYTPIPIQITNWSVPDGLHVQAGSINVSPNLSLAQTVPGVTGAIVNLSGKAGQQLNATLNLTLADSSLRIASTDLPTQWNGVVAELHSNGDWSKDGLTLPTSLIGYSNFTMQSNVTRIDLSHNTGDAANYICGNLQGGDWVGVRFPSLTITPYTFDLVSGTSLQQIVQDWGIVGSGLCGSLSTKPYTAQLGLGTVHFDNLKATAFSGTFTANYINMDIHVPWLNADLTGSATLLSGGGKQASISFPLTSPSVTKTFENFGFTASNLKFISEPFGWAVQTNTTFNFTGGNTQFATFNQIFFFGMDGRGYFPQGALTKTISLGGSSHLNKTPVDLSTVQLNAPSSGEQVLAALFNTNVHLSEVMPAQSVQVNYSVSQSGTNYTTTGPTFTPFTIDVPFPPGSTSPSAEAKIHPVYAPGSGQGSTANDVISGSVDLSELGGPPITGEFRLGYMGGHDYWLTRISYPLGPEGIPIISVPPVMNLYRVQGGLGHNFPISAFADQGSINNETPVIDNSFEFMAGVRLGMPDQFTYTLDGNLTIKAGGQNSGARLDFHSWLLRPPDNGNGDFIGYLQFAGGNFDARIWGQMNLLGGVYTVGLGSSATDAAVDLHFGPSAPWHIDAGKQNGPRISGSFFGVSSNMYFMLSDAGLSLGGGEGINLTAGSDSSISAYVRGNIDIGVTITPQPHISGDFSASVSAGACVDNYCVNAGVSAQIHAEALPIDLNATATLGLPFGASVTISVHL